MPRLVQLVEQRWREVRLSRADLATLQTHYAEAFEVRPGQTRGRLVLRSRGRVGVVALPDTQLCIRAKIPLASVGAMLDPHAVCDVPPTVHIQHPDDWHGLLDWLAAGLLRRLEALARVGLACGYVAVEGPWPYLRGRLDLARQVREQPDRQGQLYCQTEELTVDIPANQTIRATLELLTEHAHILSPGVRQRLAELGATWAGVSPRWPSEAERRTLAAQPRAAEYAPVLAACEQLRDCLLGQGMGFLLDMGRVFERHIARQLLAAGVLVQCQGTFALSVGTGSAEGVSLRFTPDLVVQGPVGPTLVADTKWKRLQHGQPEPADVYQVVAYAAMLGVRRAVLIYPGRANRTVATWAVPARSLQVEVLTVRVGGGAQHLARAGAWLARRLRA